MLRLPPPAAAGAAACGARPKPAVSRPRRRAPPAPPDLTALLKDSEPRIRRRAALAVGRVGPRRGHPGAQRHAGRHGSGRPGDGRLRARIDWRQVEREASVDARSCLTPTPLVRGRAAEALGLIDATGVEPTPIGESRGGIRAPPPPSRPWPQDDEPWPAAPEAEAFKLAVFSLVRLKAYEPLAAAVIYTATSRPSPGGRLRSRCSGSSDARPQPALVAFARGERERYTRGVCGRAAWACSSTPLPRPAWPVSSIPKEKAPIEVVVSAVARPRPGCRPTGRRRR